MKREKKEKRNEELKNETDFGVTWNILKENEETNQNITYTNL